MLRSSLGPPREVLDGGEPLEVRDLHVVVTETRAAGIDGGWWVTVTTPDGEVTVRPPTIDAAGNGGVPRTVDDPAVGGGPLFSVAGQRSDHRYVGSYEATGAIELPRPDDDARRTVITVLLIQ